MMTSGLASPQTMSVGNQRSSLQSSSYQHLPDIMQHRLNSGMYSPNFHRSILPTTSSPSNANSFLDVAVAGLNYHAMTPTLTAAIPATSRATSPPAMQLQQRRLSHVATAPGSVSFHAGTVAGLLEQASASQGEERSGTTRFAAITLPENEVDQSSSVRSFTLHSLTTSGGVFPIPSGATSAAPTLSSVSFMTNGARTRSFSDGTESHFAGNAAVAIAQHRHRAQQAAREADEADAAELLRNDASAPSQTKSRRKSTRVASRGRSTPRLTTPSSSSSPPTLTLDDRGSITTNTNSNPDLLWSTGSAPKRQSVHLNDNGRSPNGDTVEDFDLSDASPLLKKRRTALFTSKKAPTEDETFVVKGCCAICMCEPSREELSKINVCSHVFCFDCIGKWSDRENTCPLCKARFVKITRVHTQRRKKNGPPVHNTKKVKQRDQRSDIVTGASLEGLLASFAANNGMPEGFRGRLIMAAARMGGGGLILNQNQQSTSATVSRANVPRHYYPLDSVIGSDSSSEDDETAIGFGIPAFMNLIGSARTRNRHHEHERFGVAINPTQQQALPFPFANNVDLAASAMPLSSFQPAPPSTTSSSTNYDRRSISNNTAAASVLAQYHYNVRSYAANGSDPSAGHAPSNPLEIYDDDSDNDSVQVVEVLTATASM